MVFKTGMTKILNNIVHTYKSNDAFSTLNILNIIIIHNKFGRVFITVNTIARFCCA